MTDTPITQSIEKVDAECSGLWDTPRPEINKLLSQHLKSCTWPGHRLVREVAKVAQERMRERAGIAVRYRTFGGPLFHEAVAALPLELGDDDG